MESSTESEAPTVSVEGESTETPVMPTISDMRLTIPPSSSESGVTEYGELPELTAMNDALSIIQSKADAADTVEGIASESAEGMSESVEMPEPAALSEAAEEMSESAVESMETKESDEPINLADS